MKISDWKPGSIQIPYSAKRDAAFLPALYVFNCFSFSAWTQLGEVATKPWLLLVWLYGLLVLVPLLWRDRSPLTVFTAQFVLTVAAWPILPYYTPIVGIPVALYAVSTHYGKNTSLLALLASFIPNGLAAAVAFRVYSIPDQQISSFIQNAVLLILLTGGAWFSGRLARSRQQHVQHMESTTQEALEAVVKERRRIARELHDIVSHAVTVIVLQAAGAARIAKTDFDLVIQSLAHIESTGIQAMAELQRLLGVLERSDPIDHATGIANLGPQPGLADLTVLLASLRATGMQVTVHVEGTPQELDPSVDLAAYRIVQESLTNVLKHAGKHANPHLWLVWEAHSLRIQLDNDTNLGEAHGKQALSVGRGLVGLRERAHAVGGQLTAGPHPEVGYRLTAVLPVATTATQRGIPSTAVPHASSHDRGA